MLKPLLLWFLLLLPAYAGMADNTGRFLGARETVHPAWFKESFLDLREDVAETTAASRPPLSCCLIRRPEK